MARVVLVGKFPPVQGGTSVQSLWLATRLAGRGVDVAAIDASYAFAPHERLDLGDDDWAELASLLPAARRIRRVELRSDLADVHTIPTVEPLVTRLVDACLAEIDHERPDGLVANYLDPYAFAASIAAAMTGVPFAYRHAGSDLFRQASARDRARAYGHVFRNADVILTSTMHTPLMLQYGADPHALRTHTPFLTPPQLFGDDVPVARPAVAHVEELAGRVDVVFGMIGKLGQGKGWLEAVSALGRLRQRGLSVGLAVLTGPSGRGYQVLLDHIEACGMTPWTTIVPFVAPWKVTSFVRSCHVLCALEHRFGVAGHNSSYVSEILSAGRPVVLSAELRRNQRWAGHADTSGVFVVGDPSDPCLLDHVLAQVVERRAELGELGTRNRALPVRPDEGELDGWVDSLVDDLRFCGELRAARTRRRDDARTPGGPSVDALLRRQREDLLRRSYRPVLRAHPALREVSPAGCASVSPDGVVADLRRYGSALRAAALLLPADEATRAHDAVSVMEAVLEILHGRHGDSTPPDGERPGPGELLRRTGDAQLVELRTPGAEAAGPSAPRHVVVFAQTGVLGRRARAVELREAAFALWERAAGPISTEDALALLVDHGLTVDRAQATLDRMVARGLLRGADGDRPA